MGGCIIQMAALSGWIMGCWMLAIGTRLGLVHLACNRELGGCSAQVAAYNYSGFTVLIMS